MNALSSTAEQAIFGDVLACTGARPWAFLPGAVDAAVSTADSLRGEALLHALAVVEDGVRGEENDPAADNALHRIEAKLDLLTALVAGVAARESADPLRPLRWSARGAHVGHAEAAAPGTAGRFRVQPVDWLPSSLLLPATVLACEPAAGGHELWLRFGPLSPALEAALERHLFRIHRRAVAESRRPR